jgi:uncharacterized protein
MVTESRRTQVEQLFELLGTRQMDAFFARWTDDAAFEMPFAAPGLKERWPGIGEVRRFFTIFRAALGEARWEIDSIRVPQDRSHLVVEGRGHCTTVVGDRYDNRYIWVFGFRNERVTLFREYSNPLVIQQSFGGRDVLAAAFG